jgi:hypothetical protein
MSAARIVETYPTITRSQVHAALAYYYDHQDEIEGEIAEEERAFAEVKANQPSIIDRIRKRQADAQHDSLPPG